MDLSSIASTINYNYQSSSSRIQFGGLFSGLDTSSIIDALLATDIEAAERLNTKYKQLDLKQKAYQQLDDKLEQFMNFLSNFKLQSNLLSKNVETSSTILSASANASTANGTYYVKVLSLATRSSLTGGGTIGPDNISSSATFSSLMYRYTPADSTLKVQKGSSTYDLSISTTDTIDDIIAKFETIFGSGNVIFSDGKLNITSDEAFAIRQTQGTFMQVFNLVDAPVELNGSTYSMQSTAHIGAISANKKLGDIASYRGLSLNDGQISINDVSISFTTTTTLSELISAINNSDAGVTARYDENSDKLILTSDSTGANTISIDDGGSGLSQLLRLDTSTFNVGSSAHVQISTDNVNWTDLYSSSNSFKYNGLTIDVQNTSESTQTITVENNVDATVEQIKEFVNQWNDIMSYLYEKLNETEVTDKDEEEMTEEEKMQGILNNDSFLRTVFNKLRNYITTSMPGEIKYLWEIGISTGSYGYENMVVGKLEIDEDKLRSKIEENPEAIWEFFGQNEENAEGFAQQIQQYVKELTKYGGQIDQVAGLNGSINREKRVLAQQLADWIERIQKKEEDLWSKFATMEQIIAQMQAQSSYLSQISSSSSSS
ncbi:flagellar filament capping protein FliD [Pseudothermotoga sp.]|uniref:flagellar filament capping protein FliD n=1 Tax=Pseudothermotoga sp. TaxID=2033661 RepID=UPI000E9B360A|nr:flagellar filament capping protein FliD [Pseudothermotoga sp.]MDI3495599.1 flagellar hook-associated protein 2 [Pseudothermotoga sp.]MDK2885251.1 flagellar hook-associated protein 2 [Pseudothermotoga sp.]HBJ81129.1 flagellar hook protein [Pseudothermotoga sp.]